MDIKMMITPQICVGLALSDHFITTPGMFKSSSLFIMYYDDGGMTFWFSFLFLMFQ